jgi:hypothetical protein
MKIRQLEVEGMFSFGVGGDRFDKRVEAGERIKDALVDVRRSFGKTIGIGTIAGLDLVVAVKDDFGETELHLLFPDAPVGSTVIAGRDTEDEHPVGLVSRLTNRLAALEERLRNDSQELSTTLANLDQAREMIDKPFDQATRLVNLRRRQAEITLELTPKPEAEQNADSTNSPTSESAVSFEKSGDRQSKVAESHVSAFPRSIEPVLATARVKTTDTSSHRDRSAFLVRNDLGR